MSLRRVATYLRDLVLATADVAAYVSSIDNDRRAFLASSMVRSAVFGQLVIIGEATAGVPAAFRASHADVPWKRIVGLRNEVVHRYFAIDWDLVWDVATGDVPELRVQVLSILRSEFPLVARALDVETEPEDR